VPSGFAVNLFAEELGGARSLALGPGGAVFVTLSADGVIVRLVDTDGDGIADTRSTVLSGLSYPFGLAFRGDTMYFAEQTAVQRLDPGATTPVTLIPNLPPGDHLTRTIAFGPDNLLYLAIGSSCNVCDDALPRAAVTRYNLDGSNPHTFATGLRNSVGMAFHPTTGELWANNNDRDDLSDDLPPEHLNILRDGRWYGWPQCYLPGEANPEYQGADCSSVEPPALTFQAHSAPLGLAFYTGALFPAEYQGDAFMTDHGSWNRSVPVGATVARVRVQNGRPTAVEDFVTGWQLADGSRWGRPVGLLVMPDGALLVSDDFAGRIWRVSYGQTPPPPPPPPPPPVPPPPPPPPSPVPPPPPPPGDLTVTTSTSGSNQPSGYTVTVDGSQSRAIGTNSSVTFTDVAAGSHSVALTNVAANCTLNSANPQTVTVPSGGTVTASFSASCTTPPGSLRVTTSTSGSSQPSGYTVTLDGSQSQAIGTNSSITFTDVAAGSHSVALTDVAAKCTVSGANPQTVTVPSGGTVTASFLASCTTPNRPPIVNAGSDQAVLLGVSYTLSGASFSDPDNDGPWLYTIEWGDGSTSTGSKSNQGSLTGAHNYLLLGSYQITVTVTDNHGAAGSDSKLLTVGSLPALPR
jgi:glucose/arabinose dehydrogenase